MQALLRTELGRLRIVSAMEGISYLVLLGIAVPLKYAGGEPWLVKLVGPIHGFLFVAFGIAVGQAATSSRWPAKRTMLAVVSSLLPFGALFLERMLRAEQSRVGSSVRDE